MFETLGVPVYVSDLRAKELMNTSEEVRDQLTAAFGTETYTDDGMLDRAYLANLVFSDKSALNTINSIVHPAVGKDFLAWKGQQQQPYVIKETAILFEHGLEKDCDYVIAVTAPLAIRVARVVQRDKLSEQQVMDRARNQWPDLKKAIAIQFCDKQYPFGGNVSKSEADPPTNKRFL